MLQFQDLTKRLVVASLLIAVIVVVLLFAYNPIVSWCVALAVCVFAATALWEFIQLTPLKHDKIFSSLVLVIGAVSILLFFLISRKMIPMRLAGALFLLGAYVIFLAQFKSLENGSTRIAFAFFALIYVVLPVALMLKILFAENLSVVWGIDGRLFLLFLLAVTKMTDVGAYFAGRSIGKKLLAPRLSPKKTWEGAIVGWVCAVITSLLLAFLFKLFFRAHFTYLSALILGAILGVFSQLGDLAESLFKREAQVKDSNKLPGIGGVLDMVDSLLFTAPVLSVYLFL
ncbi:hypothetical protein COB21_04455 [Candidatus Aerophobetes bacterium]|uniref:Phosphatidate cytidylyltransferase n=1 Tax=Aerophobetes bacterium TaxID=2030807 RepID=A0A2A4X2S5_UNCAE|nr:MAG: hypothetical protein COB21_04455 [Candidatus Aerophobetes bacterium]